MNLYPLGLRIAGKRVAVIGGGAVGTRRAIGLLQAGAQVVVISPVASAELKALAQTGQLSLVEREFEPADLEGRGPNAFWLVHTATGVPAVDETVSTLADVAGIFCVNASTAESSSAWMAGVSKFDGVTVASFGGGDPKRAMALRDAITELLEQGKLPLDRFRDINTDVAENKTGSVALVGGGPGDPGLITAKGLQLLKAADVVVTDRLGPTALLDDLAPNALVINVGKMPDHHPVPQEEINQILVDQAKLGKTVVRLKGGDPYVLGRGGEELAFCEAHGVEVQVVPGVTSAISVPAAVGIPVTHRGVSTGFTVVTGHEALDGIDGGSDHTVVLLMGVSALKESAESLAEAKRGPQCPVAIIEDGYGPNQRVSFGTLETIAQVATERDVKSPAVIVVGDVVRLSPFAPESIRGKTELRK
jgi:uroporphyrin-III C-methyltransferase/precorrin-2 dehydrogenase/sirohydrochlorin ferrochelatase